MQPLLYRWDEMVLSFSPTRGQLSEHYHGAAELVVAFEQTVQCQVSSGQSVRSPVILIPPGKAHRNEYSDPISITLYFDAASWQYRYLQQQMTSKAGVYISMPRVRELQATLRSIFVERPSLLLCQNRLNNLLTKSDVEEGKSVDPRVQIVLDELRKAPADDHPVVWYANQVALSEDRLHHLFTAAVGLPLHRYRLWLRLKAASKLYFSGESLTYAAHEAGFADASHFSRTFKRMYGASPTSVLSSRRCPQRYFS